MARPSKFTEETRQKILKAIRAGAFYEPACHSAGVSYSTFRRWMKRGEEAKSGQYRKFWEAVACAKADAEMAVLGLWREHLPRDWRACESFLARRFPERWGKDHSVVVESGNLARVHIWIPDNGRDPDLVSSDDM